MGFHTSTPIQAMMGAMGWTDIYYRIIMHAKKIGFEEVELKHVHLNTLSLSDNFYHNSKRILNSFGYWTLNKYYYYYYIYLLETPHPRTTKQLTRTYNTAYSTSRTYHTQSSPEM